MYTYINHKTIPMGRINSRNKGSRNERQLCKWWEEWTGFEFNRIPASGGLRWSRTFDTTGDICCGDQKHALRFPFSVEAKDYKDINFEHILLGTKGCKVLQFWEQAKADGERGKKLPILMMRYNNMRKNEYFFVISSDVARIFDEEFTSNSVPYMVVSNNLEVLYIYMASDVLSLDYQSVYKKAKKLLKIK